MAACPWHPDFYRPRTIKPFLISSTELRHPARQGLLLVALLTLFWAGAPAVAQPAPGAASNGRIYTAKPGPWGELEYSRIVIEPPDEFMAADYTAAPARWNFAGFDEARLAALWQQASLDDSHRRTLLDPKIREISADGIVLRPDAALVRSLQPAARAVIYNTLARLPGNPLQNEPFRFRAEMVDEWFDGSGLTPAVVSQVRSLLYPRGNSLLFSDPGLVLPLLPTAAERIRLVKTLARKSTLLLKVRIRPESDIDTIAEYWGTGRRRKDVRPLLHSLSRHAGGMALDVAHLLPRLARGLLYTYPDPDIPRERSPDCHWTAMNFFNDTPDERFGDIAYLRQILTTAYVPVLADPAMGDLLVMTEAGGEVIHSCIYIADDIVFTKNGQSATVPWTLTTLNDLRAFYPAQPALQIRAFRKKP